MLRANDRAKDPSMRVIRLETTVQNTPVYVRTYAIESDPHLLAHRTGSPIAADQELCFDELLRTSTRVLYRSVNRMRRRLVYFELAHGRAALYECSVTCQVTDVDSLNLPLGDDVKASVTGI
jgi:hypothetical protein